MLGTRRFSLACLAVVTTGLALAPPASAFDKGYLWLGVFSSGPVKGLTVIQDLGGRTARGTVSISSAIGEGASDTVAWVRQPCSRTLASPPAPSQALAIETIEIAHEGLSFASRPTALNASLTQGRSVRVWDSQGRPLACRPYANGSYEFMAASVFTGAVRGAVGAIQRSGANRGRMYLSLGGLDTDSSYRIVGSTRSCSRAYTSRSRVFAASVPRSSNGFVFHTIEFFGLQHTESAKSLRVFRRAPGGSPVQETCRPWVYIELTDRQ